MMVIISPSILNADFLNLESQIELINKSEADWIHLDIMDGVFVPNISFGFSIIKSIQSYSNKPLDVHLMIVNPEKYIERFAEAGAYFITVHYEACPHLHSTVQQIKNTGAKAGVALNPHTDVGLLKPILKDLDMVLIMTVNPGFGGQSFIESSYEKVRDLRTLSRELNPELLIQVDGGISTGNIKQLHDAGVDVFVAGTFVFKSENPVNTINVLKNTV
ncbi:MAG: ribulose-phosphate 3-epimerase [Cyclobacteriaceae bacterium]